VLKPAAARRRRVREADEEAERLREALALERRESHTRALKVRRGTIGGRVWGTVGRGGSDGPAA